MAFLWIYLEKGHFFTYYLFKQFFTRQTYWSSVPENLINWKDLSFENMLSDMKKLSEKIHQHIMRLRTFNYVNFMCRLRIKQLESIL